MKWVVAIVFSIAAAPQMPTKAQTTLGSHILGVAICTDQPLAYIRLDVLEGPDSLAILEHERTHLRQMREWPNCNAHNFAKALSWQIGARNEAEAYCVQAQVKAAEGHVPLDAWIDGYAITLSAHYPYPLSEKSAKKLIWSFCR